MQFTRIIPLMLAALVVATPIDGEKMAPVNASLVDRSICPPTSSLQTRPMGNGNPHQNFIFKQVSATTDCTNNPSGGASVTNTYGVDWSVSEGFAGDFITGGFSVGVSVSTGYTNTFGCKTNKGTINDDLCVFERIQLTAFTAETQLCTNNGCGENHCTPWSTGIIYAPNTGQGSCYYDNWQLLLPCFDVGAVHHINSGPAGGPQFIACEPSQG